MTKLYIHPILFNSNLTLAALKQHYHNFELIKNTDQFANPIELECASKIGIYSAAEENMNDAMNTYVRLNFNPHWRQIMTSYKSLS